MSESAVGGEKAVVKVSADSVKPVLDFVDKPDVVRNKDLVQIDDAKTVVDELEDTRGVAIPEKLDELKNTLTRTADIIDDITDTKGVD